MIVFDELRITNDGKYLKVAARISKEEVYENLTIKGIWIYTDDDGHKLGELIKDEAVTPAYARLVTAASGILTFNADLISEDLRSIKLTIPMAEILRSGIKTFSNNLWFVYIEADGVYKNGCIPCNSELVELGVTFDTKLLYNIGLGYIGELGLDCTIPKGFIDFILQFEAMKIAIETCNYPLAVKLFLRMFKFTKLGVGKPIKFKPCGCNGKGSV